MDGIAYTFVDNSANTPMVNEEEFIMNKKKILSILLTIPMIISMAACGSSGQGAGNEGGNAGADSQAPAAMNSEVSGKVVIYTSMYEDIVDEMQKALKKQFPNVDVEFFQGGSGTIQSKIAAEMESGKMGCDILMVAEPSYSLELKEQGMLHPYIYPEADKLAFEYDKEGYWYPVRTLNMVLAYNPELNNKEDLPQTLKDFAEREDMKGQLSMSNPLTSGTAYSTVVALLDKYGEDYFKALGAQNVAIESGSVALTKLETGECKEIMILEESVLKKREEEGSALEIIYPEDGSVLIPSTIMIIDEAHSANNNIAACEAIEDYYLSVEGQKQIIKGWMNGVRSDFTEVPYDGRPISELLANNIPVDWEKAYKQRDEIRTMFQEYVTVE